MRVHARKSFALALLLALVATACNSNSQYFGKTAPPAAAELVYDNNAEPESLDPAKVSSATSFQLMEALFDGLTKYHPKTLEPMAGIATHYETNADSTRYTFYLRGHPNPRGTKLANTDTMREDYEAGRSAEDFSHGHHAPPDNTPARWSDGTIVTANDFVYSWRRAVDPETAADYANLVYYVKNAEEINEGKVRLVDRASGKICKDPSTGEDVVTTAKEIEADAHLSAMTRGCDVVKFMPEDLGVRAIDDFTLEVEMRAPTAFFLKISYLPIYSPVPRKAIEAARERGLESSWTQPENIVTSGAFLLKTWRPYDRIVIVKNPNYYEADTVSLDKITFLPITDPTTNVNLYKSGAADFMLSNRIPQPFIPTLREKKDFLIAPAFDAYLPRINTKRPPFDNVLVRYALNMSIDKKALTDFLGSGELPGRGVVPPLEGYDAPQNLIVTVAGKSYDVLAFDPSGARELLAQAGFKDGIGRDGRRLNVELMIYADEREKQIAEVVQEQWRNNLRVDVALVSQELKVFLKAQNDLQYNSVAQINWIGDYIDPNTFLDLFESDSANNATGWADPKYDALVTEANSETDAAARFKKLAECEKYLLKAMPVIPLYYATNVYLQKPYVRGFYPTLNDSHTYKYVWVDRNWKENVEEKQLAER